VEPTLMPLHSTYCGWHRDRHDCGCGLFDTLVYVEPGEGGSVLTRYLSAEEAIIKQVAHAASQNYLYSSQEDALKDFIALHWAWYQKY
jgi:hypothetical protein